MERLAQRKESLSSLNQVYSVFASSSMIVSARSSSSFCVLCCDDGSNSRFSFRYSWESNALSENAALD